MSQVRQLGFSTCPKWDNCGWFRCPEPDTCVPIHGPVSCAGTRIWLAGRCTRRHPTGDRGANRHHPAGAGRTVPVGDWWAHARRSRPTGPAPPDCVPGCGWCRRGSRISGVPRAPQSPTRTDDRTHQRFFLIHLIGTDDDEMAMVSWGNVMGSGSGVRTVGISGLAD